VDADKVYHSAVHRLTVEKLKCEVFFGAARLAPVGLELVEVYFSLFDVGCFHVNAWGSHNGSVGLGHNYIFLRSTNGVLLRALRKQDLSDLWVGEQLPDLLLAHLFENR
jgi:hypothetical protein